MPAYAAMARDLRERAVVDLPAQENRVALGLSLGYPIESTFDRIARADEVEITGRLEYRMYATEITTPEQAAGGRHSFAMRDKTGVFAVENAIEQRMA
jgi:hypothetical protein